jgi:transcription antitermination factor NusA-like protein
MVPSHLDIEKLLGARLEEVRKEKSVLKEKIEQWDQRLREAKRLAGNPPKENESEVQTLITQLERQYATTSQSKAEERKFLYEIEKLKQKKKSVANYNKYSGEIEMLRNQLSAARSELLEKETAIDELSSGLRKVKLAARAGCNSSELVESLYEVDTSKLPQIVGKGGMTVRSLESDFGVSVDIDHLKGCVRITGTPTAIQKAYEAMTIIMDTVSEEFQIRYETICCLVMEKTALLNEIQSKYDVRIDINQSKGICKIIGLTSPVEQAKRDITTIPSSRVEMKVERAFLPLIIGKGGSNVRSIGSENRVLININRDNDVVELVGLKNDVQNALKKINDMVDENREVEESVQIEKHELLGCFFAASSTTNIRSVGKEFSVRIDTEGTKEDRLHLIKIKGVNSKVQPAKAQILSLIQVYKNHSNSMEIADEVVPAVLGKQGATIKDMRAKYPDANIDIDGTIIHVHCASPVTRKQILDEIHAIVGENYVESFYTTEDFAIMLKSEKARELRDRFTNQLVIKMNIDKNNKIIKLKGSQSNVKQGIAELRALQSNFVSQTLTIPEEDYPVLFQSGDESLVRILCDKYKVDISANRKDLTLHIRGQPGQVKSVVDFINGVLNGDENYGSQILKLDNLVSPSFIGKAGSNIKKLEEELCVKFDLLKSRGLLRIRGDPEKVSHAKVLVSRFCLQTRVIDSMVLDTPFPTEKLTEISRKLSDIFAAEIEVKKDDSTVVTIRSPSQVLLEAKQFVCEWTSGKGVFSLPILQKHVVALKNMADYGLTKFKGKFSITVFQDSIQIKGDSIKLNLVKRDFMRAIHGIFPNETAFIEISRSCIRDIVNAELLLNMERLGAAIQCDRSLGFLWLVCPDRHLHSAQLAVEAQLSPWKALNASMKIDEFMISLILGKNGSAINSLREQLNCTIDIDRTALTMDIKCSTAEALHNAVVHLQKKIDTMRSQHWETKIRLEFVPLLIGKKGANINQFRTETNVQIEVDPKSGVVAVSIISKKCFVRNSLKRICS